jgi:Tfp pilus assembly major pilin PilA
MDKKQRGITLMGFIMVLIVGAFFALIAMKLVPIYSEFFSVKSSMKSIASDGLGEKDISEIQTALQRKFDIDYVDSVTAKQARIVPGTGGKQLNMNYEVRKPFVYNIDFVVKFDYSVDL